MREFAVAHLEDLRGKRVIIFMTQVIFSGDGARSFLDLLPSEHVEVAYAEHFNMPNNVSNLWPLLRRQSKRKRHNYQRRVDAKLARVCQEIQSGVVKRRGFSRLSRLLGSIQGRAWLGRGEALMGRKLKIHGDCTACGLCVTLCPMKNLVHQDGNIISQQNCIVCYRCVNRCPKQAITIFFRQKPKWQYSAEIFSKKEV